MKPWPIERADEGRAAADRAQRQQEAPARAARRAVAVDVGGQRRDDAEALGGVVQAEADDQHQREARSRRVAADCPIASPSAKLCRPMPTAISSERRRAADQVAMPRGGCHLAERHRARALRARRARRPVVPATCRAIQRS